MFIGCFDFSEVGVIPIPLHGITGIAKGLKV
jgi:hypothetical protein